MGLVLSQWEMNELPCMNTDHIMFSLLLSASFMSLARLVTSPLPCTHHSISIMFELYSKPAVCVKF